MSAEPRDALSRRHVVGILAAGTAGMALPLVAGGSAVAAPARHATATAAAAGAAVGLLGINGRLDEPLGVDDTTPDSAGA